MRFNSHLKSGFMKKSKQSAQKYRKCKTMTRNAINADGRRLTLVDLQNPHLRHRLGVVVVININCCVVLERCLLSNIWKSLCRSEV